MDIYNKDLLLKKIQCQIKKNKKKLIKDFRELEEKKTNNEFLNEVYDDYNDYKSYIVGLKKDQEIQILSLLHYLEKSMLEANLTERMVEEARHEEKILLDKLSKIRGELKEITENVEKVTPSNSLIEN
tara:strand:+ start:692 stop:1075 length:384 start_codon:yes stop_codon:yes gene_type:complete